MQFSQPTGLLFLVLSSALTVALPADAPLEPIYRAAPDRTVAGVYVPPGLDPLELYVIDSNDDVQRVVIVEGGPVVTSILGRRDWFVSERAGAIGGSQVTVTALGEVDLHFELYDGPITLGTIDLDFDAHFLISDDASTILAIRSIPWNRYVHEVQAFERDGTPRNVPSLRDLSHRDAAAFKISGDGTRLAVDAFGKVLVYDLTGSEPAPGALFELPNTGRLSISPSGEYVAGVDCGRAFVHRNATEILSLTTDGIATVALGAGQIAAVMERARLRIVDLASGATIHTHAPGAGAEFRSVDLVTDGATTRVAVTQLEETGSEAIGTLEIFTVTPGRSVHVEHFDPFETTRWSRVSPIVRLIGNGERAFVRTLDLVLLAGE